MLWYSPRLNLQTPNDAQVKDEFHQFIRWFWRFSQFYGYYVATPPWRRQANAQSVHER